MKIVFIDNSEIEYNSRDRYNSKLRGGEVVLINMAESLADLNHETYIINNCPKDEKINNFLRLSQGIVFPKKRGHSLEYFLWKNKKSRKKTAHGGDLK